MEYEELLMEAESLNLVVKEKPLIANDGRIKGSRIAIRKNLLTNEKACVLAEEIGHYHTSVGDIINQGITENRKQELRARLWAYNKLIGLDGLVRCYKRGCHDFYEMAEYLGVTVEFLHAAIECYRNKYGISKKFGNYLITFEPCLSINLQNNLL